MVLVQLWVDPGIAPAVGALAASDETADTGAKVVGEAALEAGDVALRGWAFVVDQGALVPQLAFVGIEAVHPVGDLALLSEALLGLQFYAEVVGLDDYRLALKSSTFDRAADLVHPVAQSAGLYPHSALGLGN